MSDWRAHAAPPMTRRSSRRVPTSAYRHKLCSPCLLVQLPPSQRHDSDGAGFKLRLSRGIAGEVEKNQVTRLLQETQRELNVLCSPSPAYTGDVSQCFQLAFRS